MKLDRKLLSQYPDTMSKEQLRIVGHMSKRTASYLIDCKLIPAEWNGKKTRSYSIRKKDVIKFFNELKAMPEKYDSPPDWYINSVKEKPYSLRLNPEKHNITLLRKHYENIFLKYESNLLTVTDVSNITGYRKSTVTGWIRNGKLEALTIPTRFVIPKVLLLEWLLSDAYNNIERKSRKHICALWNI